MKILVVSSFLPYPLTSGGHVRLFNIIKRLSKNHTIFLVCEKRGSQTEKDIEELKKYCKEVLVVDRKKQWSFSTIIKSGFSTKSFLTTGHVSPELKAGIKNVLNNNSIDVIHCETFYVMQNIPRTSIPIVLVEHNIEYQVYLRYANAAPFFIRPLLYVDILKLKHEEEYYWKMALKLIAVSEVEKKQMKRKDVVVVPNGVDTEQFKVKSSKLKVNEKEKRVLFIGDFKWIQNRIAAKWLLTDIWPKFSLKVPAKLWIVGKDIPKSIMQLTDNPNVVFDENAPKETSEIFDKADVLISPVTVGGGTSFKILEAMASGVPVVTTKLGIEGINARSNEDFLEAYTTAEFVETLKTLMADKDLYEKIAKNARKLIEEEYDWDSIVPKLEEVYRSTKE